jgi:hypothetical protein
MEMDMDSIPSHQQSPASAGVPPDHLVAIVATIGAILGEGMRVTGVTGLGPDPGEAARRWIDEGREAAARTHQPWGIEERWGRSGGA